ncbi:hypothetical protein RND71_025608 [Anisodus tanguticus]|uniref:Uncharacterized protein n=1 Tax=Anisodus tanguticus TaxID=243964 RepID=A0AAE1RSL2_9SOLA|nr:hypothetical protein RND71_025608 [Anisodus tanguticus]
MRLTVKNLKHDDSTLVAAPKKDKIEAMVAAAISCSSDDSQEVQELDVNRLYLDGVGGEKK